MPALIHIPLGLLIVAGIVAVITLACWGFFKHWDRPYIPEESNWER